MTIIMTALTPPLEEEHERMEEEHAEPQRLSPARSDSLSPKSQPLDVPSETPAQSTHTERVSQPRPRSRSPFSRYYNHSLQTTSQLSSAPMARTRSLPAASPSGDFRLSPSHSPVRSPAPTRAFPRKSFDESNSGGSFSGFMDIESIAEDSELSIPPRHHSGDRDLHSAADLLSSPPHGHTFPRSSGRRRPTSPLYQLSHTALPPSSSIPNSTPTMNSSPSATPPPFSVVRFNEPYPSTQPLAISTASSVPSTPTSLRSRSPSISSLETIPDSPDAEEAAAEAFNLAKLKAAADEADAEDSDTGSKGTSAGLKTAAGIAKDKRKRWSVCGGERRGDFEMETIWED